MMSHVFQNGHVACLWQATDCPRSNRDPARLSQDRNLRPLSVWKAARSHKTASSWQGTMPIKRSAHQTTLVRKKLSILTASCSV